eukprot:NODE_15114_length_1067_cov_4.994681.p1 GENE.NODE_15114_length_1067_cov_4.994681~~NODE_15114_length_1067_cov_4.994681.p1  ORF type:complete len:112 (-),score=14.80 NODE_15114_length_1067_cov_4.994681:504-839(-)
MYARGLQLPIISIQSCCTTHLKVLVNTADELPDEAGNWDELASCTPASSTAVTALEANYKGWRCSYREHNPEHPKEQLIVKRLKRKSDHFEYIIYPNASSTATRVGGSNAS